MPVIMRHHEPPVNKRQITLTAEFAGWANNHPEKNMKQNGPGRTAYKVAIMRAVRQIFDHPKVFEDPIALKIIGAQGDLEIRSEKRKLSTRLHIFSRIGQTNLWLEDSDI